MAEIPEDPKVVTHILGLFHLDKLCPKCNGPIERENVSSCNACNARLNLKVQLDFIETACMSIRHQTNLTHKPVVHAVKKPDPPPKKKTTRKKRKTTPRKKTVRKASKK